ncbi:hypothetical protein BJP36_40175 [Moorena producens JHB]|uniref:Uncharacterized protein n=1 Tax=Moorena producens (strain JHB) TaxID=1454205 RepID=A0A9Q9SS16_MOOP1|nr:hypothetical protein [Moorena producens]WAN68595.1 hypothetical protein BJP36_40175 [Moorena producens JHB]
MGCSKRAAMGCSKRAATRLAVGHATRSHSHNPKYSSGYYPLPIPLQKKKRLQPLLQPPLYINWEEILEAYVKNCPRCLTSSSKATLLTYYKVSSRDSRKFDQKFHRNWETSLLPLGVRYYILGFRC